MIARDHEQRSSELAKKLGGAFVLGSPAAMGEVATRNDQLRFEAFGECCDRSLDLRIVLCVPRANVEVRHVEDAGAHRRSRLQ